MVGATKLPLIRLEPILRYVIAAAFAAVITMATFRMLHRTVLPAEVPILGKSLSFAPMAGKARYATSSVNLDVVRQPSGRAGLTRHLNPLFLPNIWPFVGRDSAGLSDPRALKVPVPEYPSEAVKYRISGACEVHFSVNERGAPFDVRADCTDAVFKAASEQAVRGMQFEPTLRNGRPIVRRDLVYPLEYRMDPEGLQ